LLYLEGHVAALEAVQKRLDGDDYKEHKFSEAVTRAASSWEYFALLGCSDHEVEGLPRKAVDTWITHRETEMEYIFRRWKGRPEASWTNDVREIANALGKQKRNGLNIQSERRYNLGFSSEDISLVIERWEVAKALQHALKEYRKTTTSEIYSSPKTLAEEAVIRYRDMLKLQHPAQRTESAVTEWVQGQGDDRAPQFLKDWGMAHVFSPCDSSKGHHEDDCKGKATREDEGAGKAASGQKLPSVTDRVGLGTIAAGDLLSKLISTMGLCHGSRSGELPIPYLIPSLRNLSSADRFLG
jgi:hypothetical protein